MSKRARSGHEAIDLAVRPLVESLEQRQLLSASVEEGIWMIQLDQGDLASSDNRVVIAVRSNNPNILQCGVNGRIYARVRADQIDALRVVMGSGDDQVTLKLGQHAKRLRADVLGGAGDDILVGGPERNRFYGQTGNDQLIGGGGKDVLKGGSGDNRIVPGRGRPILPVRTDDDPPTNPDQPDPDTHGLRLWDHSQDIPYTESLLRLTDPAQLKAWLIDEAVRQYQDQFAVEMTKTWSQYVEGPGPYYRLGSSTFHPSPLEPNATWDIILGQQGVSSGRIYTGSNLDAVPGYPRATMLGQHAEADVVTPSVTATDGRYLYVITERAVSIIDPSAPDGSQLLTTIAVTGRPYDLYVDRGRLFVIVQSHEAEDAPAGTEFSPWRTRMYRPIVEVHAYNVSNPSLPALIETTKIDGYRGTSRMIEGRLYLIVGQPAPPAPLHVATSELELLGEEIQQRYTPEQWSLIVSLGPDTSAWPEPVDVTVRHYQQGWRYETVEEYRARLEGMALDQLLPGFETTTYDGQGGSVTTSGPIVRVPEVYVPLETPPLAHNRFAASLVLINPAYGTAGIDSSATIFGLQSQFGLDAGVHATVDSLYYVERPAASSAAMQPEGWLQQTRTGIYKFSMGTTTVTLEATGILPGVHGIEDVEGDQVRMSGRSATDNGPGSRNLLILRQNGPAMEIVGGLTDITWSMFTFSGDFAYGLGTTSTTVLDLSDPQAPRIAGVVPGPGRLRHAGPGRMMTLVDLNANDRGASQAPYRYQVALYDSTDPSALRLLDTIVFDERSTSMFLAACFPEQGTMVLQSTEVEAGPYGPVMAEKGTVIRINDQDRLEIVGVTPLAPAVRIGRPPFTFPTLLEPFWSGTLMIVGDYLCSINGVQVGIASLSNPGDIVGHVMLPGMFGTPIVLPPLY